MEICERMQWQALNNFKGILVDMHKDPPADEFPLFLGVSTK